MVRLYMDKSNNMACNFYFISFPVHAGYQFGFLQTSEIGRSFMWEQFFVIYFSFCHHYILENASLFTESLFFKI